MSDHRITCPNCHHQFSLSEEIQKALEAKTSATISELKQQQQQALTQKEEEFRTRLNEALHQQSAKIDAEAKNKAREDLAVEMENLKKTTDEQQEKLKEAQQRELEYLKQQRELKEKSAQLDVEVQRRIEAERDNLIQTTQAQFTTKLAEKDKQLEQTKRALDDALRRADQGSTQVQGDAQETLLRDLLRNQFPTDDISDVATGMRGADLIQKVHTALDVVAGTLIWESKSTKNWQNDWIAKLKNDQMQAGADIAIIVSRTLPQHIEGIGQDNGVWIVSPTYAIGLAQTLRFHLVELHQARTAIEGQDDKMQLLFEYLTGAQFKNRIENMTLAFRSLKEQLDKERTAMERIWSRREKELMLLSRHTSGFYGDLQGLIGHQAMHVAALELDEDD